MQRVRSARRRSAGARRPRDSTTRARAARRLPPTRTVAARCGAALPVAVATQFRRRYWVLSARLLHHEVQSEDKRTDRLLAWFRGVASFAGARHGAGQPRADVRAATVAGRDRRLC